MIYDRDGGIYAATRVDFVAAKLTPSLTELTTSMLARRHSVGLPVAGMDQDSKGSPSRSGSAKCRPGNTITTALQKMQGAGRRL